MKSAKSFERRPNRSPVRSRSCPDMAHGSIGLAMRDMDDDDSGGGGASMPMTAPSPGMLGELKEMVQGLVEDVEGLKRGHWFGSGPPPPMPPPLPPTTSLFTANYTPSSASPLARHFS